MNIYDACEVALKKCLGVKEGEIVLIIADENTRKIGWALWEKARELKAEAIYTEIIPRKVHGEEPPKPIAEAMKFADVVIAPTTKSITHTLAKKEACERGVRVATLPGITEDVFVRTLNADYDEIVELTNKIADILDRGTQVRIVTRLGTDISFSIEGRKARRSTGVYKNPGECGNLPGAEAYIAPVEGTGNGTVVVDGSMAGIGLLKNPIKLTFVDGYLEKIEGGDEARKLEEILAPYGKEARNLAEFGVGTNPNARLSGNILEDEKVFGTVHIAIGSNYDFGGKVRAPIHLDGIIKEPTVFVDGEMVFRDGKLLV
ncbi:leucyl aminopeptidase [Thermococcus chitonophagus]|uniref:Leucyl aminopeptidase n=1 Tax=Thermococcus chitonophagus TaxID=54262 RepID=A0A160VUM1_9EURY|nr:aminopeptidase [Thermococcus chitonophagus]ASJ16456.1 leucyl aminopeptidase [Thermococcus chitonophagus]CUX78549.1 Leucyl aminopeptidase [Thermococcus chitonophagus]